MNDTPSATELIRQVSALYAAQNVGAVRALCHAEGPFHTVAGGPEPLGPDETISAVEEAGRDVIFGAAPTPTPDEIDCHAATISATVRYRLPEGQGHALSQRMWLSRSRTV